MLLVGMALVVVDHLLLQQLLLLTNHLSTLH
jgi:hypothetical protein